MRRFAQLAFIACLGLTWMAASPSHAQMGGGGGPGGGGRGGGGGGGGDQSDDDAKTRKRNEEWGTADKNLSLPQLRNAGPCPYVKVLYDAARYVEMADGTPAASAVGYTGEIENLASAGTDLGTPWAEKITGRSSGASSSSSTNTAPWRFSCSTTWRLCTISWRT